MDYVRLGRSAVIVSVVGLGGGSSSRFGLTKGGTKSEALRLIRTALEEGITLFDGAGICGGVDALMAEGLAGDRQKAVVSTKVHLGPNSWPFAEARFANQVSSWAARRRGLVCSGPTLRRRVEQTLKALRTDYIDVLHLHAVSPAQYPLAVARVLPELVKMKQEGTIRATGITESFISDPEHAMLRAALREASFDTVMVGLSPRNSSGAETVLPAAAKAGVGVFGMFVLRDLLGPSAQASSDDLGRLLAETGMTLSELAFRYCRHQPGMSAVLTGTGNPVHLRQNIAAALAPPLPSSVLDRLRLLYVRPKLASARR